MNPKKQRYLNPDTGRMVGYWRARQLGLISPVGEQVTSSTPYGEFEIETVKIKDLTFDPKVFLPLSTNNYDLDHFISSDGGFLPATNVILIGSPGIGKSTVGLDLLNRVKRSGKKTLFINGEMNRIEMYRYCRRFPAFADIDILFLSDYAKTDPALAIEKALAKGYDQVLMDSWAEISRTVQDGRGFSKHQAESWILDLMEKHNEAQNEAQLFTCFLIIQQVTKNGDFLGSNRLKHMTTAMLEMIRDREENRNVMEFSKNRVGIAGERITFNITREAVTYGRI